MKAAGLSNQAFYRHFRSKHELLVAVLDEGTRILAGYLEHRMDGASTPLGRVREWLRGILAQALDTDAARATRPFALAPGRLAHAFPESVARSEERLAGLVRRALDPAQQVAHGARLDQRLVGQRHMKRPLDPRDQLGALEAAQAQLPFEIGGDAHLDPAPPELGDQRLDLTEQPLFNGPGLRRRARGLRT